MSDLNECAARRALADYPTGECPGAALEALIVDLRRENNPMPDRPWEEMYDDLMTSVDAAESRAVLAEHDRDVWRKIAEQNPAAVARAVAAEARVAELERFVRGVARSHSGTMDRLSVIAHAQELVEGEQP